MIFDIGVRKYRLANWEEKNWNKHTALFLTGYGESLILTEILETSVKTGRSEEKT